MKSYEMPDDPEGMTIEEASLALNKFAATLMSDHEHPYNVPQHPQHGDMAAHFSALHRLVREGREEAAERDRLRGITADMDPDDVTLGADGMRQLAERLLKTPGFVLNTPGALLDGDREKLQRRIHALYAGAEKLEEGGPDQEDDEFDTEEDDDFE